MNMKKIIASAAASALAVSTMAVAASAASPLTSKFQHTKSDSNNNYQVYLCGEDVGGDVYGIDVSKIASFDVTMSWKGADDEWFGGAVIIQYESAGWWTQIGSFGTDDDKKDWGNLKSGDTFNVKLPEAIPEGEPAVIIAFQNYNTNGTAINIDNIVLKDASGAAILDLSNPAPAAQADVTQAPASEAPAANADDKGSPDTGVEGVAVVAALAVLAGGAIVVAKKRK